MSGGVVMGCDIHVTMERRVWQLDAASLAALSLLRMLFLRAGGRHASEHLMAEMHVCGRVFYSTFSSEDYNSPFWLADANREVQLL